MERGPRPRSNNSSRQTYDDDFDMFEDVVNDVERRKQEEEDFFNVQPPPETNTPPATNMLMEINSSESPAVSRQSVYLDGALTPGARAGSSRSASNLSMDRFEGMESERAGKHFSGDVHDSFDDIEINSRQSRRTDSDPVVERFYDNSVKAEEKVNERSIVVTPENYHEDEETKDNSENNDNRAIATPTADHSPRNNFFEDEKAINDDKDTCKEKTTSTAPGNSPMINIKTITPDAEYKEYTTSNDNFDYSEDKESENYDISSENTDQNVAENRDPTPDNKNNQSDFKMILSYKNTLEAGNEKLNDEKTTTDNDNENVTCNDIEHDDEPTEDRQIVEIASESDVDKDTSPIFENSDDSQDRDSRKENIYHNIKEVSDDFKEVKRLSGKKIIGKRLQGEDSGNESNGPNNDSKEGSVVIVTNENKLRKSEDGNQSEQSKSENLVNGKPQGDKKKKRLEIDFIEDKVSDEKPEELALLEAVMMDLQREIDEEKEKQKIKKTVIFKRDGDTFDDKGDRRYDVSALEMVSEDECEFVNLQEVQQAREELSEYAMDLHNFNHIINELEKTPEERRLEGESSRTLTFDLGNLGNDDIDDNEREGSSNRKTPKKTKKDIKKKKKKKNKVVYSKICHKCRNPIFKQNSYLELKEIFSDSVLCKRCASMKPSNDEKKDSNSKTTKYDIGRIKAEVKPALDSRLEKSENTALQKWLEKKSKEERVKKRQERRERRTKVKELKQKKLAEVEKQKSAKQKVEDWEEKKKKEAKENKRKNNISLVLKADKSKPILHSQNRGSISSYMSTPVGESPRSDATFEVNEENSFEKFREGYLQHPKSTTPEMTYGSIKDFVQSVILSAMLEIEKEERAPPKLLAIKRPKSHAPVLRLGSEQNQQRYLQPRPPPPKSAYVRKSQNLPSRRITTTKENKQSNKNAARKGLLRAKTYDEWLFDKKVQRGVKQNEKEINEHYDLLQQKLIELEKDRRNALYQIRESSMNDFHHTKQLPALTKRLQPQGSESSSITFQVAN